MLEESENEKKEVVKQIIEFCGKRSIVLNRSNSGGFNIEELEAVYKRMKLEKEQLENEQNVERQERMDAIREKEQAIKIEQTKEEIYKKNMQDLEK